MSDVFLVLMVFVSMITICFMVIIIPLMYMDRQIQIDRINKIKNSFYVDNRFKMSKFFEHTGVKVDYNLNNQFKIGLLYIRNINKIDKKYEKDQWFINKLSFIKSFYSVIENHLSSIEDILIELEKNEDILSFRIKRELELELDKLKRKDNFDSINEENINQVYTLIKRLNSKVIKVKNNYEYYLSVLKRKESILEYLKSYFSKIRKNNLINKDYLYDILLKLISEIKNSYFVHKISMGNFKSSLDRLISRYNDFVNIFNINKEANFFYNNRENVLSDFSKKVRSINSIIINLNNHKNVLENNTDFTSKQLRKDFKYFRDNIEKLINNTYESLKEQNFKHADISRVRCGFIISELNDRLTILNKIEEKIVESKLKYMDYNHELYDNKRNTLFSKIKEEFRRYKFSKELNNRFKKVWDDIDFHKSDRTDLITMSNRAESLFGDLVSIKRDTYKFREKNKLEKV